jgi:TrmH family RNA methyltransferase
VIRDIAGRQNHSVKLARKLQKKKHRRERGLLVCEGMDLLRAAVEAGADVRDVLVRSDLLGDLPTVLVERARAEKAGDSLVDVGVCDAETLDYASSLGGAADVVFTCAEPAWSLGDLSLSSGVTFFLDGLGDPGNVGTLVRSVLAFDGSGVVCSPGTADPYGPKAMRAGMGAQFLLPVVTEVSAPDLRARFTALEGRGELTPEVLVADPQGGDDVRAVRLGPGTVVVLGSERTGAGSEWSSARRVSIPQRRFDSLNVAMAGTIVAYELCLRAQEMHGGK